MMQKSPEDKFSFTEFSLDATTFEHDEIIYFAWTWKTNKLSPSNLYIAEMENPWTIKGEPVMIATPVLSFLTGMRTVPKILEILSLIEKFYSFLKK